MRRPQLWLALCAVALIAAACSDPSGDDEWGAASEAFFAEWSDAWAGSDSYDIVRFYGADVAVGLAQDYRTLSLNAGNRATAVSGEGRAWLVKWIEDQWEAKERSLEGVFVGADVGVRHPRDGANGGPDLPLEGG